VESTQVINFDIILPSVGRLSLLQAIESVLHQDYHHWRLWIVCDGIGRLEQVINDDRVTVLGANDPCHEDFGAWARNKGIAEGSNQWIAYIDDDDVWHPNHLSTISSLLEASPHATMVRTAGQSFSWRRKSPRSKERIRKLSGINSSDILTVGMAHTRELFTRTAGWLPQDNHDKLLWNAMVGIGGVPVLTDNVTFEFAR
jgi:glycosyltransferase involved in cell wall biosynthesis